MIETLRIPLQSETVKPFIKQGDTIPAYKITITELGLDLTTAIVKMQLFDGNCKVYDIETGSGITVESSTIIWIDEVEDNNFPAAILKGDLEVNYVENGKQKRKTLYNVEYEILNQFTK